MTIDQRRQGAEVLGGHAIHPRGLRQDLLNHQGIHIHEAHLEQMKREHRHFLVVEPVGGNLPTLPIEGVHTTFVQKLSLTYYTHNLRRQAHRIHTYKLWIYMDKFVD